MMVATCAAVLAVAATAEASLPVFTSTDYTAYTASASAGTATLQVSRTAPGNSTYSTVALVWHTADLAYSEMAGGNNHSSPTAISPDGRFAAGSINQTMSDGFSAAHAVRWNTATGDLTPLDTTLNGTDTLGAAAGVNNSGVAVGGLYTTARVTGNSPAIRWALDGSATVLGPVGTPMGNWSASATAINSAGDAVGWSSKYAADGTYLGTVAAGWAVGQIAPVELTTAYAPSPSVATRASDINDNGVVVGTRGATSLTLGTQALRWMPGSDVATELAPLAVNASGVADVTATKVNAAGTAIGASRTGGAGAGYQHAVRWDAGTTTPTELLPRPADGAAISTAYAINNLGVVAGASSYQPSAVLWLAGQSLPVDLNTLVDPATGWHLGRAMAISDTGLVTGSATFTPVGGAAAPGIYTILVPQAGTYGCGDANFDASVNFADLVILAQHYNQSNASQDVNVGDFNLDGVTNFADLVALAQHYNTSAASVAFLGNASFPADWALAQSLVPEPSMLAGCGIALISMRRRRMRQR